MTAKTFLKYLPSSATKKQNNGTILVLLFLQRHPLNAWNLRRHQGSRKKGQMNDYTGIFCHLTVHKDKESIKNIFFVRSNIHSQNLFMKLFYSFIVSLFLHNFIHFFDLFSWYWLLLFNRLCSLLGHWNPLEITWNALFCKSWQINLILTLVRSYFWSKGSCFFFEFLFLFFFF